MSQSVLANGRWHTAGGLAAQGPVARASLTWLDGLLVLLLVGNLSMGRSFAHIGLSPFYIGEVSLALFLLLRGGSLLCLWLEALLRPSLLSGVVWLLCLSGVYGLWQLQRGISVGYDRVVALQTFAFNLYPLFLFFGLQVGRRHPRWLPGLVRLVAWVQGLYGITYVIFLRRLVEAGFEEAAPDAVALFGEPVGCGIVILGLVVLEPRLRRVWLPLLLNGCVLLALLVRAEFLGLVVGLALCGCLARRLGRLCGLAFLGACLLLLALASDIRIPSPATRGGELSARSVVAKFIAPFDLQTAKDLKGDTDTDAETVSWRTGWWRAIWRMVDETPQRTLFGPGYGYPLWDLHPEELPDIKLRTPHNVFMFALGYTGWMGVVFFCALQLSLAQLLWRAYRLSGQPFGLCVWAMLLVKGTFEDFFETPFNAIPFYLLVGLALAPLYQPASDASEDGAAAAPDAAALCPSASEQRSWRP